MIDLINETIKTVLTEANVKTIIDIESKSILIKKPFAVLQFLGERFEKTGYTLVGRNEKNFISKVLTKYIVTQTVSLNIVTQEKNELITITECVIDKMPEELADRKNNIVKVKIAAGEFKLNSGKLIGTEKIDITPAVSRLLMIDFIYHITEEERLEYLRKVEFRIKDVK